MNSRTPAFVLTLLLCAVGVTHAVPPLAAPAQLADKPAEPEDPTIVTSEMDKLDLVVKARPILPAITTGDPMRIAVHFETKGGPIDQSDAEMSGQMFDREATLDSMEFAIKAPGADKWEVISVDGKADAAPRQTMLMTDGTMLLELGSESIKSLRMNGQQDFALPWKFDGMLKPGMYQIAARGTLNLSTRERTVRHRDKPEEKFPATKTEVAFRTKPISIDVARADMRTQTLDELAEAAVEAVQGHADIEKDNLTVKAVESIPIVDKDGNRVIRVRADLPPLPPDAPRIGGGRGYWQYEVAMSPDGKPKTIARWRKGFCVAEGTKISTPDGKVAVEQLRSGALVWAFDRQREQVVAVNVLAVFQSTSDETIRINDDLRTSPDHPLLVKRDGKADWMAAAEVRVGDFLFGEGNQLIEVTSVRTEAGQVELFDVAVDGPHNFFADGVLVHNKSIAWSPQYYLPWYALWNRAPIK